MDNFQRIQEAKLQRAKLQQQEAALATKQKPANANNHQLPADINMKIPNFSELRKKAVLVFFIQHFINLIKKSNEFRAYGQSLMLVMQAQNLVKILEELGYDQNREVVDLRVELERLRNVSRAGAQDYWHVNWGYKMESTSDGIFRKESKRQYLPLPDPPSDFRSNSPIPGTESPEGRRNLVNFVEIHETQEDSTDM